jgi:hypothetical protein
MFDCEGELSWKGNVIAALNGKFLINHIRCRYNLILDKIGQKNGKIKILRSGTSSFLVGTGKLLFSPYP